jgi:hypothetical protein
MIFSNNPGGCGLYNVKRQHSTAYSRRSTEGSHFASNNAIPGVLGRQIRHGGLERVRDWAECQEIRNVGEGNRGKHFPGAAFVRLG